MSLTINVTDLTNQDAVHRILSEIQHHGASYALVQEGVEVAKVVPVKVKNDDNGNDYNGKVSPEVAKKRREALARMDVLAKKIAELWSTDETAAEAVANNRR